MQLNICVLGSGSTGNSTAIWTEEEAVLVDCGGLGIKYITDCLLKLNISYDKIKGILITHGHRDHFDESAIKLSSEFKIPVYINQITYNKVKERFTSITELNDLNLINYHTDAEFEIGKFYIKPFSTFHSNGFVGKPFGFCISHNNRKIGYLTDTGKVDDNIIRSLTGARAAIIESNHQETLVINGERDDFNKEWILSDYGHLSNKAAAKLIYKLVNAEEGLQHVFLAHISQDHNTIYDAVSEAEEQIKGIHVELIPTYPAKPSKTAIIE